MYLEYFMLTSFLCIKFGMTIFYKIHYYTCIHPKLNVKIIEMYKKTCL